MKKPTNLSVFLSLVILAIFPLSARRLTPAEAWSRAVSGSDAPAKMRAPVSAKPVYTACTDDGTAGAYVFSLGEEGCVIVGADTRAEAVLGYTDRGSFDPTNIPPQLQYMLDFYSSQVKWASDTDTDDVDNTDIPDVTDSTDFEPIEPLIQSQWDQGWPYYNLCPFQSGLRTYTGCVATAMAQVMRYYRHPSQGFGENRYNWGNTSLYVDFTQSEYDWESMTDTYDRYSTAESCDAVAKLMYDCGVAVDMSYSYIGSGANNYKMALALYNNFGYDRSMTVLTRDYYLIGDWNEIVYRELSQGRPVLYCGQNNAGGHQFICDGYSSNGYFHINWGWSGVSDGYFKLDALRPTVQGAGGNSSQLPYHFKQSIIINLFPAREDSEITPLMVWTGYFSPADTQSSLDKFISFYGNYINYNVVSFTGSLGVKLNSIDGEKTIYLPQSYSKNIAPYSPESDLRVFFPAEIEEGIYLVSPIFKSELTGEWNDIPIFRSFDVPHYAMVRDGTVTFSTKIPEWPDEPEPEDPASAGTISAGEESIYYNLQGLPVSTPRKGDILIRRQGKNASMIIF